MKHALLVFFQHTIHKTPAAACRLPGNNLQALTSQLVLSASGPRGKSEPVGCLSACVALEQANKGETVSFPLKLIYRLLHLQAKSV